MQIRLRRIDGRKLIREFEEGAPDWVSVHYYIRAIHTWPQIGNIAKSKAKSVIVTDEGARRAKTLFKKNFVLDCAAYTV